MRFPMISSLLSQPIVEYFLGIPPWEACEGGVDRSVARRAFAQDLPIAVTARSGKGSPDGFVGHYIDTHRTEIFERLMDGTLDRKRTRLNSSHYSATRMPSSDRKKKNTTQQNTI